MMLTFLPPRATNKRVYFSIVMLLVGALTLSAVFAMNLTLGKTMVILPTLATILLFLVFSIILAEKIGNNFFGEIGFVYLALVVAYTIIPALTFLTLDIDMAPGWVYEKLALFLPDNYELGKHLWRHVLFIFGVSVGYLAVRGNRVPKLDLVDNSYGQRMKDYFTIFFVIGLVLLCVIGTTLLSAPVSSYADHYTRFKHLSWSLLRLAYVCFNLKTAGYYILLVFLFLHYKKFKYFTLPVVVTICVYEMAYSFGSRIDTLSILLGVICLYHFTVNVINIKKGITLFVAIAVFFSFFEVFRASGFDVNAAQSQVVREGGPASEFGAVYFTGFHLYADRAAEALPEREWPMFFSDFIALVPFADHERWHPQYWYARNYFPDSTVPPQTNGIIADSAMWGGEWDLLMRGLINGAIFAYLVRWFWSQQDKWWALAIYSYSYATCVMTLKYSLFNALIPFIRILLPGIILVELVRRLFCGNSKKLDHMNRQLK